MLALFAGCRGEGITFYEVVRSRVEECLIRDNGEFCVEPDQFDPPSREVWSTETRGEQLLLYFAEEIWLLEPLAQGADPALTSRTATKDSFVVDGQGGCRTDLTRTVSFVADGEVFSGSLSSRSVLTGPASCGSTPVGERTLDNVAGGVSGP
jgi:hypothetical protein